MPGQPRKRAFLAALDKRTADHFEGTGEGDHLDYVCAWVESGRTVVALSRLLFQEAGIPGDPLPAMLGNYLRASFPDYAKRIKEARAVGAHAVLELTDDIASEAVADSADAARARNRIGAAQHLASVWNREEMGRERPGVTVNLNAGALHLDAMRARAFVSPHAELAPPADVAVLAPSATAPATMAGASLPADMI